MKVIREVLAGRPGEGEIEVGQQCKVTAVSGRQVTARRQISGLSEVKLMALMRGGVTPPGLVTLMFRLLGSVFCVKGHLKI
jgi:hypothetical protein